MMKKLAHIQACGLALGAALMSHPARAQVALYDDPRPGNVTLQETDEGIVFADSNGRTLYTGRDPKPGISACTNEVVTKGSTVQNDIYPLPNPENLMSCVQKHPPALAGDEQPVGDWTIIARPDGLEQWAYQGRPLYTSIKDRRPGDINEPTGEALFAPAILPPEVKIKSLGVAKVLSTPSGQTLYMLPGSSRGKAKCDAECQSRWSPLLAPALALSAGDWTVVPRDGKAGQWAFKGKPLYTFSGDVDDDSLNGDGVDSAAVALAYPLPPVPQQISTSRTVAGWLFADAQGMTVYTWSCTPSPAHGTTVMPEACDDPGDKSFWWYTTCGEIKDCPTMWRPVMASDDDEKSWKGRMWSVVTMPAPWAPVRAADGEPGLKVWAYRGRPVFRYGMEDRPSMVDATRFGIQAQQYWNAIDADGSLIGQPRAPTLAAVERKAADASR